MTDETENQEANQAAVYDARPIGRPTDYKPEFCQLVSELAQSGATDEEIAQAIEISVRTLYRWYAAHPEFRQSAKLGKEAADDRVERAFFHRAVGYSHEAVKIMQDKGSPVIVRYIEHVPPDPGAAMNWLKNRRPEQWKDTKALTGADGGPIALTSVIEFVDAASEPGSVPS